MQQQPFATNTQVKQGATAFFLLTFFVVLTMWGCPQYNVYKQKKEGEAQLASAQYSRQVKVAEANATFESSSLLARADTIRAHGIARSNQIIDGSLTEKYIHWFFVDNIEKNPQATIYIPTEAGMPITEAGRFRQKMPAVDTSE